MHASCSCQRDAGACEIWHTSQHAGIPVDIAGIQDSDQAMQRASQAPKISDNSHEDMQRRSLLRERQMSEEITCQSRIEQASSELQMASRSHTDSGAVHINPGEADTEECCEPRARLLWQIVGQASSVQWDRLPDCLPSPETAAQAANPSTELCSIQASPKAKDELSGILQQASASVWGPG